MNLQSKSNEGYAYYPTDLVYGLLSGHCADETGKIAGESNIQRGNSVTFSLSNPLYKVFKDSARCPLDINIFLEEWEVLKVMSDESSGYLGVVYLNDQQKQIVLAHRSTNFALSLTTKSILKESGLSCDIEGVLKGRIVAHQLCGYEATVEAISISQDLKYSLSFTGHSLGAWLANLSLFYCHTDLDFSNTKSVVFDGPGAFDMVERMTQSYIKGSGSPFDPKTLDIVEYLSVPNIVNCVNSHVGIVYTVFPSNCVKIPDWLNTILASDFNRELVVSTCSHDLKYILPEFDLQTGRPRNYKVVQSWPSITYKPRGGNGLGFTSNDLILSGIKYFLTDSMYIRIGEYVIRNCIEGQEPNTLNSIVSLLMDFVNGKIAHEQYWLANKYISSGEPSCFRLAHEAGYLVAEVKPSRSVLDNIDEYLRQLKSHEGKMFHKSISGNFFRKVKAIVERFDFKHSGPVIEIRKEFLGRVSIHDLRDKVRELLQHYESDFTKYLNEAPGIGNPLLTAPKLPDGFTPPANPLISSYLEQKIEELWAQLNECRVSVLRGMPGIGKKSMAHRYSRRAQSELGFVSKWFNASSEESLLQGYKELADEFKKVVIDPEHIVNDVEYVHTTVAKNGQKLVFIFDRVKCIEHVQRVISSLPTNVQCLITSRHQNLGLGVPEVCLLPHVTMRGYYSMVLRNALTAVKYEEPSAWKIFQVISLLNSHLPEHSTIPANPVQFIVEKYGGNFDVGMSLLTSLSVGCLVGSSNDIEVDILVRNEIREMMPNSIVDSGLELLDILTFFPLHFISLSYVIQLLNTNDSWWNLEKLKSIPVDKGGPILLLLDALLSCYHVSNPVACFLTNVKKYLTERENKRLEAEVDELVHGWSLCIKEAKESQAKAKFVLKHDSKIQSFLEDFNYFKCSWEKQCLSSLGATDRDVIQHFVVMGGTGNGKSTLVNSLLGIPMLCDRLPQRDGQTANIVVCPTSKNYAKIGNLYFSETTQVLPFLGEDKGSGRGRFMYWDCPGFKDNNGVLREIRNSFYIRSLNKLITDRQNFHLLVTIKDSLIFDKELVSEFVDYFENSILASLGVSDLEMLLVVKDMFSLVITQSSPPPDGDMREYKERFLDLSEHCGNALCKKLFAIMAQDSMLKRIIFYPKITKLGPVLPFDLDMNLIPGRLKGTARINFIKFHNSISVSGKGKLATLADLLNYFSEFKITEISRMINETVKRVYFASSNQGIKHLKTTLKAKLFLNSVSDTFPANDPNIYLSNLRNISNDHEYTKLIELSFKCLNFLETLNNTIGINYSVWVRSITKLQYAYKYLMQGVKESDSTSDIVKFVAPIISTSELASKIHSTPKSFWVTSFIFIVDEDLEICGTDLVVNAHRWILCPGKMISLKGRDGISTSGLDGERGGDSGNFYGRTPDGVDGGKLTIDLSGGKGGDGNLDTTQLTAKILVASKDVDLLAQELRECELPELELKDSDEVLAQNYYAADEALTIGLEKCKSLIHEKDRLQSRLGNFEMHIQNGRTNAEFEEQESKYKEIARSGLANSSSINSLAIIYNHLQALDVDKLLDYSRVLREKCNEVENKLKSEEAELKKLQESYDSILAAISLVNVKAVHFNEEWSLLTACQNRQKQIAIDGKIKKAKNEHKKVKYELENMTTHLSDFLAKHEKYEKLLGEYSEASNTMNRSIAILGLSTNTAEDLSERILGIKTAFDCMVSADREWDRVMAAASANFMVYDPGFIPAKSKTGKRLTPYQTGRDKFVSSYDKEVVKLEKELQSFMKEYDANQIRRELVKEMLCVQIQTMIHKFSGEEPDQQFKSRTTVLKNNLKQFFENRNWLAWLRSFVVDDFAEIDLKSCSPAFYSDILTGLQNAEQLKHSLEQRLNSMKGHASKLREAYQTYTECSQKYQALKRNYTQWKKKLAPKYQTTFKTVYQDFDKLQKCAAALDRARREEAGSADKLLLNRTKYSTLETNMCLRLPSEFSPVTDNALTWLLDQIFLFNTKFTERYGFSGTVGGRGGDSGNILGLNEGDFIHVVKKDALGGESGLSLTGVYTHEHTFAWLRNIRATDISVLKCTAELGEAHSLQSGSQEFIQMALDQVTTQNERLLDACVNTRPMVRSFSSYQAQDAAVQGIVSPNEWEFESRRDAGISGIYQGCRQWAMKFGGEAFLKEMSTSTIAKLIAESKVAFGIGAVALQALVSALVAHLRSGWVDGPYEGGRDRARKGGIRSSSISQEGEIQADYEQFVSELEMRDAVGVIFGAGVLTNLNGNKEIVVGARDHVSSSVFNLLS